VFGALHPSSCVPSSPLSVQLGARWERPAVSLDGSPVETRAARQTCCTDVGGRSRGQNLALSSLWSVQRRHVRAALTMVGSAQWCSGCSRDVGSSFGSSFGSSLCGCNQRPGVPRLVVCWFKRVDAVVCRLMSVRADSARLSPGWGPAHFTFAVCTLDLESHSTQHYMQ
jgi:hypothetical protein